jgi:tyrosyl-tRNA synthetase
MARLNSVLRGMFGPFRLRVSKDILFIASQFTVQQMMERDMFQVRLKNGKPIYLNEFLYPLMQGYDSVAMDVDVEVGGTDQTFNMLAGRTLQKKYHNKEKFVISTTLLENPITGKKLMSKSEGGFVALNDEPNEMFGKIMALPDQVMKQMFLDCTFVSMDEILKIEDEIKNGANPKNIKAKLAKEIVKIYHSEKDADEAEINFEKTFAEGNAPTDLSEIEADKEMKLVEIMLSEKIVESKTEWRRLVGAGAVTFMETGEKISDQEEKVKSGTYKIGKKRFLKIKIV